MSKLATHRVRATAYSACIAAAAAGTPQRGSVHSVFAAAANILFPGEFILSLNASSSPQMPNGLRLSVPEGEFPFSTLRPGMPILLGASRLHIEALACSIDLTACPQWDPHINHHPILNLQALKENRERLYRIVEMELEEGRRPAPPLLTTKMPRFVVSRGGAGLRPGPTPPPSVSATAIPSSAQIPSQTGFTDIVELVRYLCGRGVGLTPTGDDLLAGWMAVGWLLYGPEPTFLAACEQIMEVAHTQTHLLSRCWLGYAAEGNVALPVVRLLEALAREASGMPDVGNLENNAQLELAAQAVLALGATSGCDVISGILFGLEQFLERRTEASSVPTNHEADL